MVVGNNGDWLALFQYIIGVAYSIRKRRIMALLWKWIFPKVRKCFPKMNVRITFSRLEILLGAIHRERQSCFGSRTDPFPYRYSSCCCSFVLGATLYKKSPRLSRFILVGMKFGKILLQINMHRLTDWRHSFKMAAMMAVIPLKSIRLVISIFQTWLGWNAA